MGLRSITAFFFCLMIGITVTAQSSAESEIEQRVADSSIRDMVVVIGNAEGIQYSTTKGDFDLDTVVSIASASKWLTSATIMTLLDDGLMSLDDTPADYFDWWTDDPADPRSQVTVSMLLSFTSGFNVDMGELRCLRLIASRTTNENCTRQIYDYGLDSEPGTAFSYGGAHMHILGAMAEVATGQTFNQIFLERIAEPLGMSDATYLADASEDNPQPAGGFVSTANDYALFLQSLLNRDLFSDELYDILLSDHTSDVEFLYVPDSVSERYGIWHYAYGSWLECDVVGWSPDCDDNQIFSSGGAFGWFPWIDLESGTFGIVGQEGRAIAHPAGQSFDLAFEIRPLIPDLLNQ